MEYYYKWGRHYMPSVQRAHGIQQSNNFKDPGIQFYGGRLFQDVQADADDIFNNLPAPVPKYPIYQYYGGAPPAAPAATTTMASYNDRDAGCVHGDCATQVVGHTTLTEDSNTEVGVASLFTKPVTVAVKDLKKGDIVRCTSGSSSSDDQTKSATLGVVECLVETQCDPKQPAMQMVAFPDGLRLTPWHPVRKEGSWKFPADLYPIEEVTCNAVYSVVVRQLVAVSDDTLSVAPSHQAAIVINGVECAALGHGVCGDKVASHPFFGETSLADLRQCCGWKEGRVVFDAGCFVRDGSTRLVTAFDLSKEISAAASTTPMAAAALVSE